MLRSLAIGAALLLASCATPSLEPVDGGQPWFCEDYVAEGEVAPEGCVHEPGR